MKNNVDPNGPRAYPRYVALLGVKTGRAASRNVHTLEAREHTTAAAGPR